MRTSSAALIRNITFFAQGALFGLLACRVMGLSVSEALFILAGAALGLCGLIQVVLVIRSGEPGISKGLPVLTGASAAGITLGAILHNVGAMLKSYFFGVFFFALAVFVFPVLFVGGWFGSLVLLGTAGRPVSRQRRRAAGLVSVLAAGATACAIGMNVNGEGYSVSSQLLRAPDGEIERVLVAIDVDEALVPVFRHSFEHSLISAFESNGIEATIQASHDAGRPLTSDPGFAAVPSGALIHVTVDPLYRTHRDGYEALVGAVFEASLVDASTGEDVWHLSGKVDYIADQFFSKPGFRAHEGIRKEFAWHTTAAIVRTFMADVVGRESAPIYTVTEARQGHGQRTD